MRGNIKGVAFDLDGTLYPNYRLNVRLLPFILKEWRLLSAFGEARNIIRTEQEKGFLAQGDFYDYQSVITAKILSVKPDLLKEKIEKLIYRGWEPIFKKVKLFKKVHETLDALRKAGYKLGLLSDFPPEQKLEYLNLTRYWDIVLSSEQFGALKPHPLPFLKLAQAMSLPPEEIIYVGNSHHYYVIGAAGVGMKTALIKPLFSLDKKKPKPDFSFHSYRHFFDYMLQ